MNCISPVNVFIFVLNRPWSINKPLLKYRNPHLGRFSLNKIILYHKTVTLHDPYIEVAVLT